MKTFSEDLLDLKFVVAVLDELSLDELKKAVEPALSTQHATVLVNPALIQNLEVRSTLLEKTQSTSELLTRVLAGEEISADLVESKVLVAEQSTTKTNKKDLTEELKTLDAFSPAAELSALLGPALDPSLLENTRVESTQLDVNTFVFTLRLNLAFYPETLGGSQVLGEVARVFEIQVNYAPWRDRRVRRLQRVKVYREVLHPEN